MYICHAVFRHIYFFSVSTPCKCSWIDPLCRAWKGDYREHRDSMAAEEQRIQLSVERYVEFAVPPQPCYLCVLCSLPFMPGKAGQFMNTYTEYLPKKIYMSKNYVTYIHQTVRKYVRKCMKLYIKQTVDMHSTCVLDAYILQFGYIYIVIWTYILQFGHKYGNSTYTYHFSTFWSCLTSILPLALKYF